MKNLKIAQVKVRLWDDLPYINKAFKKYHFDISAFNWDAICQSNTFKPIFLEQIMDTAKSFAAILPSKRKWNIDNYMAGSTTLRNFVANTTTATTTPFIVWSPLKSYDVEGSFKKLITNYDQYPSEQTQSYVGVTPPTSWKGPAWTENNQRKISYPDDVRELNSFLDKMQFPQNERYDSTCLDSITGSSNSSSQSQTSGIIPNIQDVWQQTTREGLWWAIRSNDFLFDNMPFWVTVQKNPKSPTSQNHQTYIVIRIGHNDPDNKFDIWIGTNQKPFIIDYKLPPVPTQNTNNSSSNTITSSIGNSTSTTPIVDDTAGMIVEFDTDLSKIMDTEEKIEIGVMTVAGRLVIFVNNNCFIYTRIDKGTAGSDNEGGKLLECKIANGPVDIYGTNIQATINVCPMVFAPMGIMAVPVPRKTQAPNAVLQPAGNLTIPWKGIDNEGEATLNSVCHLPTPPPRRIKDYGCDCKIFVGNNNPNTNGDAEGNASPVSPSGTMFHLNGKVRFKNAGATDQQSLPDLDFYYISLFPENTKMALPDIDSSTGLPINNTLPISVNTVNICYGGTPYFFRIMGGFSENPNVFQAVRDITDYVISIDENDSAGDYFSIKKTANITLYNPAGVVSNWTGVDTNCILKYQKGIDISWSWKDDEDYVKTFTGVITNVNSNEIAGKETLTLSCEDYMYILRNTPIINSPFYDGMIAYYAIKEIATRAGLMDNAFVKDWQNENDYFLPSGFSFSQPAMKFTGTQSLFDCMVSIVKRFEAYIYFDGDGRLHINKLPGGLFSVPIDSPIPFYSSIRNPTEEDPDTNGLILGERNIDFNYDSTVNNIVIRTVDRDDKNTIIHGKSAEGNNNHLMFRKPLLIIQPALGGLGEARAWVEELSRRVFKTILKTGFSTVGGRSTTLPLTFATVDGQCFRLTSVKRDFNADNNDFKTSYEAEWLGG